MLKLADLCPPLPREPDPRERQENPKLGAATLRSWHGPEHGAFYTNGPASRRPPPRASSRRRALRGVCAGAGSGQSASRSSSRIAVHSATHSLQTNLPGTDHRGIVRRLLHRVHRISSLAYESAKIASAARSMGGASRRASSASSARSNPCQASTGVRGPSRSSSCGSGSLVGSRIEGSV